MRLGDLGKGELNMKHIISSALGVIDSNGVVYENKHLTTAYEAE